VIGQPAWRRIAFAACLLAGIAACSSDKPSSSASGPSASASASSAGVAGTVTPKVLCVDAERDVAYFGYENAGAIPVTIPVGPSNNILGTGGTTPLTTQQTAVFAPGNQGVSAWTALEGVDPEATWSITGADGVTHTAAANLTSSSPCLNRAPPLDPPDDRTAKYDASVEITRDATGRVSDATVTIKLTGLPNASRCPSGSYPWTADPPEVQLSTEGVLNATEVQQPDRSIIRFHVDDPHTPPAEHTTAVGFASANTAADVYDHCHDAAGTTSSAWGASASLIELSQFEGKVCFGEVRESGQDSYGLVDCSLGPGLALTGGIRSR
jgi:hypothetical protein